ncbi:MAG: ATP-binding protein, partial [Hyphomonadaceae bacterium]
DLQVVLRTLAATVTPAADGVALSQSPNDPRFGQTFSGRYWQVALITADGGVDPGPQLRSASLWDEELPLTEPMIARLAADPGGTIFLDAQGPNDQRMRIAAQRVRLDGVAQPLALMAAADVRPVLADARRFTTTLFVALGVLGAGLLAAVFLQVRIALAPLNRVRADIADVRRGRRAKLEGAYPDEIAPLTTELNALLDHNRDVVERARTHVGNLAHALKTPISVLLNEARASEGPLADLVRRQTEGMARNVEHYLQRAQAAARAEALGARTPVKPVLEDIARTLVRLYGARKDIDIAVEAERDAVFRGERQDLEEMAGNLMDNACKYGRGAVRVQLAAPARTGETFSIAVEDDGAGLSAEQRDVALQRGVRLDERETGAGLGLSIIADLSRAYGGQLALGDSALGGLKATLTLPSAE